MLVASTLDAPEGLYFPSRWTFIHPPCELIIRALKTPAFDVISGSQESGCSHGVVLINIGL